MSFVRLTVFSTVVLLVSAVAVAQPASRTADVPALHNWPLNFRTSDALVPDVSALPSAASHFIEMAPCRVYDSRVVAGGPGPIPSGSSRTVAISGGPCAGIPASAAGFSLNFTVTGSASSGSYAFLTAYPTGTTRPNAATVNFKAGTQVGNAAIVPAGTGGAIDVYVSLQTEVIVDINGYFAEGVVTSVVAGTGLSGGGTGDVNLSIADGGVGAAQLSAAGSTAGQVLASNGTTVSWQTASGATGGAGGDLSGTYPNPSVATVGGQAAANVASGAVLANGAANTNTPDAIVRRDAFGDFSAGTVTLSGNLTLPATTSSYSGAITIGGEVFVHGYGGSANMFVGRGTGNFSSTGISNTILGCYALPANTNGSGNSATGAYALTMNTEGSYNTADGLFALFSNTSGSMNTASGEQALFSNLSASLNTAIGGLALLNNTSGERNVAIGYNAGSNIITGSDNLDLASTGYFDESSTTRIGDAQTRAFIAGVSGVTTEFPAVPVLIDGNGQLGTASSSRRYKFDIADMDHATDDLLRLRPVTFRYLAHGDGAPLQYGLIAEEVADVYPELVARTGDGEVGTVMYQFLAPMLLNVVQQQQKTIERIEGENAELRQRLQAVEDAIDRLKRKP